MSLTHLSTGSECPPLQPGKIRIYAMRFCPYAQRALLVAAAKNLPHDVVYIDLTNKPKWIFEKNSGGKVPTVQTEDGVITESLIIADYLDEASLASPQLHPKDAFRKAEDRIWVENFGKVGGVFYKILFATDTPKEDIPRLIREFEEVVTSFGKELTRRGTKYFAGADNPGMVDYMIWPWFERRPAMEKLHPSAINYEQARETSQLEPWIERMKMDSAVKEYLLTPEIHYKYNLTVRAGKPNANMLWED